VFGTNIDHDATIHHIRETTKLLAAYRAGDGAGQIYLRMIGSQSRLKARFLKQFVTDRESLVQLLEGQPAALALPA
jgi:hypothetical protein